MGVVGLGWLDWLWLVVWCWVCLVGLVVVGLVGVGLGWHWLGWTGLCWLGVVWVLLVLFDCVVIGVVCFLTWCDLGWLGLNWVVLVCLGVAWLGFTTPQLNNLAMLLTPCQHQVASVPTVLGPTDNTTLRCSKFPDTSFFKKDR